MGRKDYFRFFRFFIVVAALIYLSGCPQNGSSSMNDNSDQKESSMNLSNDTLSSSRSIPSMDVAVPAVIGTATFGQG